MLSYIARRLARSAMTLFIIVTVVFCLLRLMPIEGYFNEFDKMTPTQIRVGLDKLELNKPLPRQLMLFYKRLFSGDLGVSNKYRVNYPAVDIIREKAPLSLKMGLASVSLALIAGLPLGIAMARSASTKSRLFDRFGMLFVVLVQAVPAAVYHLFIQMYGTGFIGRFIKISTLFSELRPITWILPVFSLSLFNISYYALWLRRYMVDESNRDYVILARAKGVPAGEISRRHIFRNAMVPIVQYIPTSVVLTLMGSIYVESLYSIPGMGGLLVDVIKRQDNSMVQALVLVYTAVSILGLLLGDIAMAIADPRISLAGKKGAR